MNTQRWAPVILRAGLAFLFLWFGFSQLADPSAWVSWVPAWAASLSWVSPTTLVFLNGGFEIILGLALAAGFYTRWAALLLSVHLFFIAYEIGYNDIGVRDFALALSTLALSAYGTDEYSLDKLVRREI